VVEGWGRVRETIVGELGMGMEWGDEVGEGGGGRGVGGGSGSMRCSPARHATRPPGRSSPVPACKPKVYPSAEHNVFGFFLLHWARRPQLR